MELAEQIDSRNASAFTEKQMNRRICVIRRAYCVLGCLSSIAIPIVLLRDFQSVTSASLLQILLSISVYFFGYYGLKTKKTWVIPLLLIFPSFMVISHLLWIFTPAVGIRDIVGKGIDILAVLFYGYQIHFFSRKEVKQFFRAKGKIIFT